MCIYVERGRERGERREKREEREERRERRERREEREERDRERVLDDECRPLQQKKKALYSTH